MRTEIQNNRLNKIKQKQFIAACEIPARQNTFSTKSFRCFFSFQQ